MFNFLKKESEEKISFEKLRTFLIGLVSVLLLFYVSSLIDKDQIQEIIEKGGVWSPILFMLAKISTIIIAPLSGAFIYPLAGILFGTSKGLLYVFTADFIGYTTAFYISRIFGKKKVEAYLDSNEVGVLHSIVKIVGTPKGFFTACFLFFPMPELLAYGGGLSQLKYRHFIAILMPLSLAGSFVLVSLGELMGFNKELLFAMIALFLVILTIVGVWKKYVLK